MAQDSKGHGGAMVNRRDVLATTGGLTIAGMLSGCTGGGDSGTDGGGTDGGDGGGGSGDGGSTPSSGSDFPSEAIEIIIPFGPGGGFDTYSRLLAQHMEGRVPVDIVPRNIEGGGGRVGHQAIFDADPDGHTIGIMYVLGFVQPAALGELNFDLTEYTYLPQIAMSTSTINVDANGDIGSFEDYVSRVQSSDAKFAAQGGLLSKQVTTPVMLGELSGLYPPSNVIDNVVFYDTKGDILTAFERDEVDVLEGGHGSTLDQLQEGVARRIVEVSMNDQPLGIDEYDVITDDVQTLAQLGVENGRLIQDISVNPRPFIGPPGIPDERAQYLREVISETIQSDEFLAAAEEAGRPVQYRASDEVRQSVLNAIDTWDEYSDLLNELQEASR